MRPTDDRGQLIIVAAIGLAVTLVALALILNSAIYTQNVASRNLDSGAEDAVTVRSDVSDGLGGVMNGVNRQPPRDYATLDSEFKSAAETWSHDAASHGALRGQSVRVTGTTTYDGVRVVDDDSTSTFQPFGSSATDWVVAPDVRARAFTITAHGFASTDSQSTVESTLDGSDNNDYFYVDVDGGQWQMAVYDDGGTTKVTVYDGSPATTCSADAGTPVTVDIGAGTVNGMPCPAMSSISDQKDPYTIEYENGDEITGTYELTVDRVIDSDLSTEAGPFTDAVDMANYGAQCEDPGVGGDGPTFTSPTDGDSGNSPYVTPALYSGTADVNFHTQSVDSYSTVRVADRELSSGASTPRITSITVDDNSDATTDDSTFEVTVEVADPDGDLSSVSFELVGGGTTTKPPPKSVSGTSDSAAATLDPSVPMNTVFDLTITVSDLESNTRTVSQTHESDGDTNPGTECPP